VASDERGGGDGEPLDSVRSRWEGTGRPGDRVGEDGSDEETWLHASCPCRVRRHEVVVLLVVQSLAALCYANAQ
jgi:hypothetical protein